MLVPKMESLQIVNKLYNSKESCPFVINKCELLYNSDKIRKVLRVTLGENAGRYNEIKISICCYNADGLKLSVMDDVPYVNGGMLVELSSLLTESVEIMVKSAKSEDGILWTEDVSFPDNRPVNQQEKINVNYNEADDENENTVEFDSAEVDRELKNVKTPRLTKNEKKLERLRRYEEEEEIRQLIKNDPTEKKKRIFTRLAVLAVIVLLAGGGIYAAKYKSDADAAYKKAMNLYNGGKFEDAAAEFEKTENYIYTGDKRDKLYWAIAMSNSRNHNFYKAALYFKKSNGYKESIANYRSIINAYEGIVSAGKSHTVCLKGDGTVLSAGDNGKGQCNIEKWSDMSRISAGGEHTVAIDRNKAVYATGDNSNGQCDVSLWKDIVDISAGERHTVGVENIGRVVATGDNAYGQCDIDGWSGIIAVSAGSKHTVGLKLDGTVVAVGDNQHGECNVESWDNIILIAAGNGYTAGLKDDGEIVVTGDDSLKISDAESEKNVLSISAGYQNLLVVYEDGTVKAFGLNDRNQNVTDLWRNIVAACGGECHSVGITSDGKAFAVGSNEKGQASVSEWNGIDIPKSTVTIRKGE